MALKSYFCNTAARDQKICLIRNDQNNGHFHKKITFKKLRDVGECQWGNFKVFGDLFQVLWNLLKVIAPYPDPPGKTPAEPMNRIGLKTIIVSA